MEQRAREGRPGFAPGAEVIARNTYDHEIYSKAALLTDAQFFTAVEKSAKQMQQKPYITFNKGPDEKQHLYIMSLDDLPPKIRDTCRKIKISYTMGVEKNEMLLTPETQLTQNQPSAVFEAAASVYMLNRPEKMASFLIPTFAELREKARRVETAMQVALLQSNSDSEHSEDEEGSDGEGSDEDEDDGGPGPGPGGGGHGSTPLLVPISFSLGSISTTAAGRRPKAKARAATASAASAASASGSATAGQKGRQSTDDSTFDGLDEEMRKVAEAQLEVGLGLSFKALKSLIPAKFAASSKMGRVLAGVRGLRTNK